MKIFATVSEQTKTFMKNLNHPTHYPSLPPQKSPILHQQTHHLKPHHFFNQQKKQKTAKHIWNSIAYICVPFLFQGTSTSF